MEKVSIKELFLGLQAQMIAQEGFCKALCHPVDKRNCARKDNCR
ncbi:hypothetical protein [Butyrivibrio sp. INlla16]|nr:hypothetical protein [Butyrivibrio sp. INlla16]